MRQVVLAAAGELCVEEGPLPDAGSGELRVRAQAVGICRFVTGHHRQVNERVLVGERVQIEPNLICGECIYCRGGGYNLCEHLGVVGCQTSGACASRGVHRTSEPLPPRPGGHVDDRRGAGRAGLDGTHAVRIAEGVYGHSVAVLGAGSIGLLTMLGARAGGTRAIVVTDPIERKRDLVVELGADFAVDPTERNAVAQIRERLPWRPDVVFDCVANQSSTVQATELGLKGGTVVVEGVPRGEVTIPLHLIEDRELRLQGTAMYMRPDQPAALIFVASRTCPQTSPNPKLPKYVGEARVLESRTAPPQRRPRDHCLA